MIEDNARPDTLMNQNLVVMVSQDEQGLFWVGWKIEKSRSYVGKMRWILGDESNPAKAVRRAQEIIRAAMDKHIMDAP